MTNLTNRVESEIKAHAQEIIDAIILSDREEQVFPLTCVHPDLKIGVTVTSDCSVSCRLYLKKSTAAISSIQSVANLKSGAGKFDVLFETRTGGLTNVVDEDPNYVLHICTSFQLLTILVRELLIQKEDALRTMFFEE